MTSDNVFLSTLQHHTVSSSYALPSDKQLWTGPAVSDERAKSRRVQKQVKMKLAEKSTLPRQNGAASSSAMSDYGGSSNMKYSTQSPSFSSKSSYMYSGSKTLGPRMSQKTDFSSRSAAPDMIQFQRMSVGGGGGGGGGFYREDIRTGGFQGSIRQNRMDQDAMSVHSMRNTPAVNSWVIDNSDAGSMVSERDATFGRQYAQSAINGYSTQMRQGGGTMTYQTQAPSSAPSTMCRSGPMVRGATLRGGGSEFIQQQSSFKGPAHRTINRIANRNRASVGSMYGTQMTSSAGNLYGGGDQVDRGFVMSQLGSGSQGNLLLHRQGNLSRSMSIKSMHSVGRGMDIYGQTDMEDMGHLQGLRDLDMTTAIKYLKDEDQGLQVLGAAYIQHQCYNETAAKDEMRERNGIGALMKLFTSSNSEVRRYATGAARNLIYENKRNKILLIDNDGILQLVHALKENDDEELHKNITGILWNLSSKDDLKEKLAKETLPQLSDIILIPAMNRMNGDKKASDEDQDIPKETPSQAEIFCNTTGCLRNLSSGSVKTRQCLRDARGLTESLVNYLTGAIDKGKAEEKGVENTVCILRNLSYQLYKELPPSYQIVPDKEPDRVTETIGCFSPNSKKAAEKKLHDQKRLVFRDLVKVPKGIECLWHPSIVNLYHRVVTSCEINATTREAAIGALQNITAGDEPWPASMCSFAVEQVKILPSLMNQLRTDRNKELLSLTGLLRNLSRHNTFDSTPDPLVNKLPNDGNENEPSAEVVMNICGVLNNMVIQKFEHAKNICKNSGLEKLMGIKNTISSSPEKIKASSAAATVLANMYHYKKLHKIFKEKKLKKTDFETIHT